MMTGDRVFVYELNQAQGNGGRQTQILVSPHLNTSFGSSIAAFGSSLIVGAPRLTGLSIIVAVCVAIQ